MSRKKSEHYVNNKELLEALIVYRTKVEKSHLKTFNKEITTKEERAKHWDDKPKISNYLGECFLKIATHLSYKPNFVNYMFREDMVCDGIENCLQYVDNFDPAKSSNPFAYFTQIIYYAFLRKIQKEKKQLEIKSKIIERCGYSEVLHSDRFDGSMAGMNDSDSGLNSIKENIEIRMSR